MRKHIKHLYLASAILLAFCRYGWTDDLPVYYPPSPKYGPSQASAAFDVALVACRESHFQQDELVVSAMQTRDEDQILRVLGTALEVWRATPETSALYPARTFCIHELVPKYLQRMNVPDDSPLKTQPTPVVTQFKALGVVYWYYADDGDWVVQNPVDLVSLATEHLNSRWGREAFLMMTKLGWSSGNCQEGPDHQFREVIKRGEAFLTAYPKAETSNSIRFAVASAYATWWTLSITPQRAGFSPEPYGPEAEQAREKAIELYLQHEELAKTPNPYVENYVKTLREKHPLREIDFFCEDYED